MGRSALIAAAAAAAAVMMTTIAAADALSFPEGTETSTVSLSRFSELTNDKPPGNWRGNCDKTKGLPITVQVGDEYSIEMTPPGVVVPEVVSRWFKLFMKPADGFEDYEGPAGVIVTMPARKLEQISASAGAIINVLPGVSTADDGLEIEAHTGATVYVQEYDDDELDIDADGGASVFVYAEDSNDDLSVEIDADHGATVFVLGAEQVDVDAVSYGASITLIGDNLESVEMDDVDYGSTVFAQFTGRSRDYMSIDEMEAATVTVMALADIDIDDGDRASELITDNEYLCFAIPRDVTCTVTDVTAPDPEPVPEVVIYDVSFGGSCKDDDDDD